MLFDGDCGFCVRWIRKWQKMTGNIIRYAPFQEKLNEYPELNEQECKRAVQLILPGGKMHSGARAVFMAFALAKRYSWLLWTYDHVPLFGRACEIVYQLVARHRLVLSKFSRSSKKCGDVIDKHTPKEV